MSKIKIDIDDLLEQLEILYQEAEYEQSLVDSLRGNPIMHINYEEAFESASTIQVMTRQVFEFLGVSPLEQTSLQSKILPKSLKEIIDNYEEVVNALQPTRYAQYLD